MCFPYSCVIVACCLFICSFVALCFLRKVSVKSSFPLFSYYVGVLTCYCIISSVIISNNIFVYSLCSVYGRSPWSAPRRTGRRSRGTSTACRWPDRESESLYTYTLMYITTCICMYICIYIYIYIYIYIHIHIHIHICIYIYIYTHISVYTSLPLSLYISLYINNTYVYI